MKSCLSYPQWTISSWVAADSGFCSLETEEGQDPFPSGHPATAFQFFQQCSRPYHQEDVEPFFPCEYLSHGGQKTLAESHREVKDGKWIYKWTVLKYIGTGTNKPFRAHRHTTLEIWSEFQAWLCYLEPAPLWSEPFDPLMQHPHLSYMPEITPAGFNSPGVERGPFHI